MYNTNQKNGYIALYRYVQQYIFNDVEPLTLTHDLISFIKNNKQTVKNTFPKNLNNIKQGIRDYCIRNNVNFKDI